MTGNQSQNQNKGNQSRSKFYKKKGTGQNHNSQNYQSNSNNNKLKIQEYKFYLHDAAQRKMSKSFNKIKEAIILKIQKTFNEPREVAESIKKNAKKVLAEPGLDGPANTVTHEERQRADQQAFAKWKVKYEMHQAKVERFEDNWVRAYSLIWES